MYLAKNNMERQKKKKILFYSKPSLGFCNECKKFLLYSGLWPWFIPEFKQSQGLVQSPLLLLFLCTKFWKWNFYIYKGTITSVQKSFHLTKWQMIIKNYIDPRHNYQFSFHFNFYKFLWKKKKKKSCWSQIFIIPAYFFFLWWF